VNRIQHQACIFKPFRQRSHRDAVVVVEVGSSGEHFDTLESMSRDVDEMVAIEFLIVKKVRGNAKARAAHGQLLRKMGKY
jgi:hypothetical protein